MDTDELISALAADDIPPAQPRLAQRIGLAMLISAAIMLAFWGGRPDWAVAMGQVPVLIKQSLPILLAVALFALLQRGRLAPLWPLVALAVLAGVGWLASVAAGGDLLGDSLWQCLLSIPALALPIGVAIFAGLRHRVEPDAGRAGLVAGLLAGASGAAIYAVHCNEDSPAFFLIWYGLAILICGLIGRAVGRRVLGV